MPIVLKIDSAPLNDVCKDILRKLLAAGYDKADTHYVVDSGNLTVSDFQYLLRLGAVNVNGGINPVLRSYATPKFGPEVGKIGFVLNFDLA